MWVTSITCSIGKTGRIYRVFPSPSLYSWRCRHCVFSYCILSTPLYYRAHICQMYDCRYANVWLCTTRRILKVYLRRASDRRYTCRDKGPTTLFGVPPRYHHLLHLPQVIPILFFLCYAFGWSDSMELTTVLQWMSNCAAPESLRPLRAIPLHLASSAGLVHPEQELCIGVRPSP